MDASTTREKDRLFEIVDGERDGLRELARRLWERPEIALEEHESARLLAATLEREGFDVEMGVGALPTAFVATYGSGSPTIGFIGEYDALPGLSQIVSTEQEPVEAGGAGHGCGHNLHGVGATGGAIAIKRGIEAGDLDGTIAFLGCPAEETLVGKVYMARAGAFDDLDAAIAWHPDNVSTVRLGTANALNSIEYRFEGTAAHAAATPEAGRSALDAVQLMNTGVEYVREHVPDDARIHYVATDGGDAPNVVPASAAVWYFVRAPSRERVDWLTDWVDDVAVSAAKMTRTTVERVFRTGCYPYLPNETLGERVWANMQLVGPIDYSSRDHQFAAELRATVPEDDQVGRMAKVPDERVAAVLEQDLYPDPIPPFDREGHSKGTADLGDVCWNAPTVQFKGAAWPVGVPSHSWQAVAANGDLATKAVTFAAKVFAGTAYDLFTEPSILEAACEEFAEATAARPYESPLPEDADPFVDSV